MAEALRAATEQTGLDTWIDAIDRYDRGSQEWRERCEKIIKIYLDQHRNQASPRRFALLWSNIETLKPAVYARLPVAVVSRRFKDSDPAGRKASEVLERCINTTFDLSSVDPVMQLVRDDRLLCGRGTAWVRYEAQTEGNEVAGERVVVDHVHWADFGHTLNRTWPEVTAVWRRVYMTRGKVKARFGKAIADKLNYEVRAEYAQRTGGEAIKDATEPQAIICEIWDRATQQVIWMAKEEKLIIERGDPPLNFRNFWPCPKPVFGTLATGSLIPTPDYRYYQDQAEEIDDLTQKIADLTGWLRLKGFYAGGPSSEGSDALEELLKLDGNQVLIKLESMSGYTEKGGVRGLIEWIPLDTIIVALREAVNTRKQLIDDVFQITGISDILRGETNPNETLGAQEIKAQTGSRRQSPIQRDIARFARDLAEMTGEVISEVFQPDTIAQMSGYDLTLQIPPPVAMAMLPPDQQQAVAAQQQQAQQQVRLNQELLAILRDEKTRGFRIEIETDSTIEPDEQAEKQRRVEFIEAVGSFLQSSQGAVTNMPILAPMLGEMLMFLVRGFRAGRSLEDLIEQTMQQLTQMAQQPKPDPAQQKLEMEAQAKQVEMQQDAQRQQFDQALQAQQQQFEQALQAQKSEQEKRQADLDMQLKLMQAHNDAKEQAARDAQPKAAIKVDHAAEQLTGPIGEIMASFANQLAAIMQTMHEQHADTTAKHGEMMGHVVRALTAPRRVVRDQHGRATHSEPMMMQ